MEAILGWAAIYCLYYAGACIMKKPNPVASAAKGLAFTVAVLVALGFAFGFMLGFAGYYGY